MVVSVTVRAPAKVNLHLGVGPRRPDGFHDLATVFHAVSLYDDVTVNESDELSVGVVGIDAEKVPTDEGNLAARAAIALARLTGRRPNVHIDIRKGIPVAGGMAGGSADAAATLVACDTLWGCDVGAEGLHELACGIGSDVPFGLVGGTALGSGRGESLTTVLGRGTYHWAFATAESGLSTPAVYQELDRMRDDIPALEAEVPQELLAALRVGDANRLGSLLSNDLQAAALRLKPALRRTLEAGREANALGAVVSGSGPTCAFLAATETDAAALVAALSASGACRAAYRAHGPVPGARVVDSS